MTETKPPKHPGGRPTDYKPEYCEQAEKLCLLGATDAELADFFHVSESTVNLWKTKHPEFSESLARGKTTADAAVAAKLHSRATGYEFEETVPIKTKKVRYENGKRLSEDEEIVEVTVKRVVPPDTQAATYWLNNRRPKDWKHKQEHEHSGKGGEPIRFTLAIGSPDAKAD